ncbi:hypothetical protein INR49_030515 [Caranx melampygus]|nr:hypothetical protein INR49_030515 [Caranx melampygus]
MVFVQISKEQQQIKISVEAQQPTTRRSPSTEAGEGRREAYKVVPRQRCQTSHKLDRRSEPVSTRDHLFAGKKKTERERKSGDEQLALDADSVVCRKEEGGAPPLLSLWHTDLSPRSCKQKHKQKGGRESSASRQKHFLHCTSCGWSQRSASWSHCSAFFLPTSPTTFPSFPPSFLPSFLPSFFFFFSRASDVAPSSLLRCHWPATPTVSSVPCGYCRDVTSSWQHHWASPPSPMGSSVTGLQRWGAGGLSHGGTVRRYTAEPPRSAPLHAPAEVND